VQDLLVLFNNAQNFIARPLNIMQWTIHLDQILPDFPSLLSESFAQIPANALHLIESTTRNFIWVLVILVTTYYLLMDWPRLRDWILGLPAPAYREDAKRIHREIKEVWRGYLRGNLVLMLIVGVAFTIAWAVLGVPGALVLGVIAGLLTIIPDLGPFIAALIAIAVALVEGSTYLPLSNFWFAVLVTAVYISLINVKSIYIRPRVFGRSVHMHEGLVFVTIMAAVILAGVLGALIVVPLLVSIGIIVRYLYRLALGQPLWPEPEEKSK
jgi:predicted PurR-regulated permease PerM